MMDFYFLNYVFTQDGDQTSYTTGQFCISLAAAQQQKAGLDADCGGTGTIYKLSNITAELVQ